MIFMGIMWSLELVEYIKLFQCHSLFVNNAEIELEVFGGVFSSFWLVFRHSGLSFVILACPESFIGLILDALPAGGLPE